MNEIPFNRATLVGTEADYIEDAVKRGWLSAGGHYTALCEEWLAEQTGAHRALLTHSCTAALEGSALLAGLGPGDEVIMPSFTFVTTATAFAVHGATPVFVDIDPETLNIDPERVAEAITPATRAVVPIHYAGVGADVPRITEIAANANAVVIEDAAQAILATRDGRALGTLGDFGTLSFHETKNVTCGEGGALLVNRPDLIERAEIVWQKGTNRRQFERGEVQKYTWVDIGSSFGLGEVAAAFLWGQLERAAEVTNKRLAIWERYHEAFAELEADGLARRPCIPAGCQHNAHMYYLLLSSAEARPRFLSDLRSRGVSAVFHYVPLHTSPAGARIGRAAAALPVTEDLSARLVRLPLWSDLESDDIDRVIESVKASLRAPVGA